MRWMEYIACEVVTVFLYIMNMNFILQSFNCSHFLRVTKALKLGVRPSVREICRRSFVITTSFIIYEFIY